MTKKTCEKGATKPKRKPRLTQNEAIVMKAVKLAACLRCHNKNLNRLQYNVFMELWDVIDDWEYVRTHLHEYNLDGVRRKPD